MEDFASILEHTYGLKPQGKMAPMSNAKSFSAPTVNPSPAGNPRNGTNIRSSAPVLADDDPFLGLSGVRSSSSGRHNTFSGYDPLHDDLSGGPPPPSTYSSEDIFRPTVQKSASVSSGKGPSSYPDFDAPIYDDDILGGMPSADSAFEDFSKVGSSAEPAAPNKSPSTYADLLGGFGNNEDDAKETNTKAQPSYDAVTLSVGESALDDLLSGFGEAEPAKPKSSEDGKPSQRNVSKPVNGFSANILEDPFAVFGSENVSHTNLSTSVSNPEFSEVATGGSNGSRRTTNRNDKSTSSFTFENDSPNHNLDLNKASAAAESNLPQKSKLDMGQSPNGVSVSEDSNDVSYPTGAHGEDAVTKEHKRTTSSRENVDSSMPASSAESTSTGSPAHRNRAARFGETDDFFKSRRESFQDSGVSPSRGREEVPLQIPKVARSGRTDEFWLSIDDVKLVTQPTAAPPPVRPPPLPGLRQSDIQWKPSSNGRPTENGGHSPMDPHVKGDFDSSDPILDDLEAFASGRPHRVDADVKDYGAWSPDEQEQGSAAATASGAAMREAIEKAEAKLRQAKEAKDREREEARSTRNKESRAVHKREDRGENKAMDDRDEGEREEKEREAREKWRKERERDKKEREKKREREREREKDRANEIAWQRAAVERANAEVREREAQKTAQRAAEARMKAERAAVERATAEARERLERAAAEKARAERAAAAERERAEKEKMATSREQQPKNGADLESFFRSSSRPTSAPKQRTHPTNGFPTAQAANEELWRSTSTASNVKKVSSMPSMADDLTSLFGGPSSGPGMFQEVDGETEERRKARWDRYQRMLERAAKALEEKHRRDLQSAKEQEERHRAGELVDAEIKRWAAGKEGNLRALLSTLQYVLWPECGWQPVSLTELITAASVKKVYRKATLHVHPDKVQQKGATSQQKYIAEKVFDLLKEAWNKFNSEELF